MSQSAVTEPSQSHGSQSWQRPPRRAPVDELVLQDAAPAASRAAAAATTAPSSLRWTVARRARAHCWNSFGPHSANASCP
eukprot:5473426-Prymnesium_polylepis.1